MTEEKEEKKEKKEKKPLPLWRRILLVLILAAIAVLAGLMAVSYLTGRQLEAEIVKISKAGEPVTFSDLRKSIIIQTDTKQDAAMSYYEALIPIGPQNLEQLTNISAFYRRSMLSLPPDEFPAELRDQVGQSLKPFEPILEKCDKAAQLPLSHFDLGIERGIENSKPLLDRIQVAGFVLSLRTMGLIVHGQYEAAANSAITMLKLTRIFNTQPTMFLFPIKVKFDGMACDYIRIILERADLSDKSLKKLQKALSEVIAPDSLERILVAERTRQIEILKNMVSKKISSEYLVDTAEDLAERLPLPSSQWTRFRIRQKSISFFKDMAKFIAAARKPWPAPLDEIHFKPPKSKKQPIALQANAVDLTRMTAELMVAVRSTMLAASVERYRNSEGKIPESLSQLVPYYADAVPSDPFTAKQLLYKKLDDGYVIYSAGINRIDDDASVTVGVDRKFPKDSGTVVKYQKNDG